MSSSINSSKSILKQSPAFLFPCERLLPAHQTLPRNSQDESAGPHDIRSAFRDRGDKNRIEDFCLFFHNLIQ